MVALISYQDEMTLEPAKLSVHGHFTDVELIDGLFEDRFPFRAAHATTGPDRIEVRGPQVHRHSVGLGPTAAAAAVALLEALATAEYVPPVRARIVSLAQQMHGARRGGGLALWRATS